MITSTAQAGSAATLANLTLSMPKSAATAAQSTDPFAQELASVLEQFLGESSGTSSSSLNIKISKSQVSDGSQLVVTISQPDATGSTPTGGSAGTTTSTSPITVLTPTTPSSSSGTPASTTSSAIDKSKMTPDQAYWAEQPAAVQALQNMDPATRGAAAQQLAQQGYAIDVPIMVWGWDPLTTMIERQNYGYSWVPSGNGSPVAAPGASNPLLPAYNAANPPSGSIQVSTDFAKGTNMQNQFVDAATIQASFSSSTD